MKFWGRANHSEIQEVTAGGKNRVNLGFGFSLLASELSDPHVLNVGVT